MHQRRHQCSQVEWPVLFLGYSNTSPRFGNGQRLFPLRSLLECGCQKDVARVLTPCVPALNNRKPTEDPSESTKRVRTKEPTNLASSAAVPSLTQPKRMNSYKSSCFSLPLSVILVTLRMEKICLSSRVSPRAHGRAMHLLRAFKLQYVPGFADNSSDDGSASGLPFLYSAIAIAATFAIHSKGDRYSDIFSFVSALD